ncbi:MAG: LamG domain-containing protein [Pirellulales bacterium]|nr:LamG domain-containing protein [Pirellulales bacterium]
MNRLGLFATFCAALWCASTAQAVLVNQYTFNNGTANDTGPGAQHGTVVDPTGISKFIGGQLDLTANNGVQSATPTNGAYVNLPNGIASAAIGGGQANEASFEMWVTVQQNRFWARLFDFGGSNAGEDTSEGANEQDYLMFVPQGFNNTYGFESHPAFAGTAGVNGAAVLGAAESPLPTGVQHHIVVTYDQNDTTGGPGGTAKVYLNNAAPIVGAISANMPLGSIGNEVNSWLGRAQWNDALIDASYEEFRIYDHALTDSEVTASSTAGPVEAIVPTLVVDRDTGAITLQNQTSTAFSVTSYTISSAAGGLEVSPSWDPIAPANGWTIQTNSSTELRETGGTPQAVASAGSIALGSPWVETPIEDLVFSFNLSGGGSGLGLVEYVGNGGVPHGRSDFDTDGTVDVDDWVTFLNGHGDNLAGLSDVAQYLKGDLNGDNATNHADFLLFRGDFIADNSLAAFEALTAGVPEPSALALAALASLAVAGGRSRRRGR